MISDLPENAYIEQEVQNVKKWWATSRWDGIKRPYTADQVVSKRGTLRQTYPSSSMATKLFKLLQERSATKDPVHTSTLGSLSSFQHFVHPSSHYSSTHV